MTESDVSDVRPRLLGAKSRIFLFELSIINLVLGAFFLAQPEAAATVWAWAGKPLAVRFLGAIFLAITLGCWTARWVKVWQRGKILVLVGAVFFSITIIITLSVGLLPGANAIAWAWAAYFLAAATGLWAILKHHGWHRRLQDRIKKEQPWKAASAFFRIQTVLVGLFGSFMLFDPDFARDPSSGFWPWQVSAATLQVFAALFLATCLATGWASLQTERARIRALLPLDAIFPSLALLAVGIHWGVIASESPSNAVTVVWIFVYSFVAAGSIYLLWSTRETQT